MKTVPGFFLLGALVCVLGCASTQHAMGSPNQDEGRRASSRDYADFYGEIFVDRIVLDSLQLQFESDSCHLRGALNDDEVTELLLAANMPPDWHRRSQLNWNVAAATEELAKKAATYEPVRVKVVAVAFTDKRENVALATARAEAVADVFRKAYSEAGKPAEDVSTLVRTDHYQGHYGIVVPHFVLEYR